MSRQDTGMATPESSASATPGSYRLVHTDPPDGAVRRVTFVPFQADGTCLAVPGADGLALPDGMVEPGEHYLLDTSLRVLLMAAGFRLQRVHPFAVADLTDGLHVYLWAEGARYCGRRPHRPVELVSGSAETIAARLRAGGDEHAARLVTDAAGSYRDQDEAGYHAGNLRLLEPAYLRGQTPQAGSGFGGTAEQWRDRRGQIVDGLYRDGTFLDVGCANGLLMESVRAWAAERGRLIEPYGVDIAPRLVELARRRLPAWADRIEVGNAVDYRPTGGRRFTFVHALFDSVPAKRYGDLVRHLRGLVEPRGRLLMSQYRTDQREPSAGRLLAGLGFDVAGESGDTAWLSGPE